MTAAARSASGRPSPRARVGWGIAAAALVVPLLPFVPDFWVTLAIYVALAGLVALGLVLLTGIGGMTSFGQAAFVGIGAYATGWITTHGAWSPWLALPIALGVTALSAALIGIATVRLSAHFLPLGTLCWGISIGIVLGNAEWLGGHDGIRDIPGLAVAGLPLDDPRGFHVLTWLLTTGCIVASLRLLDSRVGRAIRSLRQGAVASRSFGVDIGRTRLTVFVFAAMLASLSGWLYAVFQHYVSAGAFGPGASIDYLLMAVAGGGASVFGAFVGSALMTVVRDALQDVLGAIGNFEGVAFGILLVAILQGAREGLWPVIARRLPPARPRTPARVTADEAAPIVARTGPLLEVAGVRKQFGGLVAVDDVSFEVGHGEIVALIGPNGAGKSTLFDVITGIQRPTAGDVRVSGRSVVGRTPQSIARDGVGRTFQHVKLVDDMSVLDNVALGAHLQGRAGAWAAVSGRDRREEARLLGIAAQRIAEVGLDAQMHRDAGHLSLGQMRIVEIARALCLAPRLVLLDEPAAGLRHFEKQALSRQLVELRSRGISVLIVEHDVDFVMRLADRVVVVDFGHKIAEGTPDAVRRHPAVIEAYLGGAA